MVQLSTSFVNIIFYDLLLHGPDNVNCLDSFGWHGYSDQPVSHCRSIW